jgi:ABC-type sugar transport system substrate-binding protein/UDP-2,3-diacylglucosamine pyrophosphatase LpxH
MDKRDLVAILSDIHMGTAAPTVWYRKEIHETHLIAIFDQIIAYANLIREVILLGDIFEFWSYPPGDIPPTIDDIIATHPNILGSKGKVIQMLSALQGRVVFVPGEHDSMVTSGDLHKLRSPEGYTIKYIPNAYVPEYDNEIVFIHGHEYTLLNTPYYGINSASLSIGYFMNRAMSYKIANILGNKTEETIADLEGFGAYNLEDYFTFLPKFLKEYENDPILISRLIDMVAYTTGISKDLPININKTTRITLNEVKKVYDNSCLDWHIKKNSFKGFPDVVIMGHTHYPIIAYKNSKIHYANTGLMCPSITKLQSNPITYGIYNISNKEFNIIKVTGNPPVCSKVCSDLVNDKTKFLPLLEETKYKPFSGIGSLEEKQKSFTFGWSSYDDSWEFYHTMQLGVFAKAEELGIEILKHDQESNEVKMLTGCLELIRQGVNALLLSPYKPEGVPEIVESAQNYNTPVVVMDGGTNGADVAAFIVSDSFAGGIFAGEYSLVLINKYAIRSKNVAIIKAETTATFALLRGQGFKSVMVEKGYTVIGEVMANGKENQAYEGLKKLLESCENNLAVVFCENGLMTIGAARAIGEAGEKGNIMLVGFDADSFVMEGIENGSIQGTIAQQPFKMGQIGVEVANAVLVGAPVEYDDWTEKIILMEVFLIDENGEVRYSII